MIGIGGGGDVVGALACAELARGFGTPAVVGGITWERRPIDPLPGPRRLDEVTGARRLHDAVALTGPDTTGPGGFRFAETGVAELLGEPTLLVDPNGGPQAIGAGLTVAACELDCDVVVLLDVGGDALAHGDERGLASPLADAVMIAAAPLVAGARVVGAVFGAGCDGELEPAEVAQRLAEVDAAGGGLGELELTPAVVDILAAAVERVPTEASAMALRCARGARGTATIRQGRRIVQLTPAGGRISFFEPEAAMRSAARLAAAVAEADDLAEADAILNARGVRTELRHEREAARERASPG